MSTDAPPKIFPVILSGGVGTRLWPMSRSDYPKQFHGLFDTQTSLMQETIRRVSDVERFHPPIVIGSHAHRFLVEEQLKHCGIAEPKIILEPCARNTAPAIMVAAQTIAKQHGNALMLVLPTDQYMPDQEAFLHSVERAARVARQHYLVAFGTEPKYPETGYGYIRRHAAIDENGFHIAAFVEKPSLEKAKEYIASGDYYWNSGMFLFPTDLLLDEMEQCNPDVSRACREAEKKSVPDLDFMLLDWEEYSRAPNISIDYALMEKTKRAAIVPLDGRWSDTGAWEALWRISPKDAQGNVTIGQCHVLESGNCYVRNESGPAIAAYGVDNLVIVSTKDAVLVTHKDRAQSVKTLVEHISANSPALISENYRTYRPWGMYERINSGAHYQVKHIMVKPGEKLSLQMHYHRAEHWVVVSGTARVTCDDKESILSENQSMYIPCGSVHRLENCGKIPLEIIEIQTGAYLEEDDIVRFEDQYGRMVQKTPVEA